MSGWEVTTVRRWRFYPTWMPWRRRRQWYFIQGGDFVYGRDE